MSLGPLYVFLGEVSVQVLCLFFNCIVCLPGVELCEFFIYFGDETLVQDIIDKYILPQGWFPFHFAVQKLFNLMQCHLFIFSFISLALGDILVKILLRGISEVFPPMFSSRIFMVSQLIFKSFIHLEFIFVYGVSWWSSFIFFACVCPDLPTPFIKEAIFYSILCFCLLCQILVDHRDFGLSLGSLFSSIDLCVCSYARTRLF